MANAQQLYILRQGWSTWNAWRQQHLEEWIDLRGANLSGADLRGATLSRADLRDAKLNGADLSGANLRGANLSGANLSVAGLFEADLSGANLSSASLSNAFLRRADLFSASLSNAFLRRADLSSASLSNADCDMADLSGANLRGADLSRANLSRANLSEAFLRRANLQGAHLAITNFRWADLSGADFRGAYLIKTDFQSANLRGANFDRVPFDVTNEDEAPQQQISVTVSIALPQAAIDPNALAYLQDALYRFMETWGFGLEGGREPVRGSFFRFWRFRSKHSYTPDTATMLQEHGHDALQRGIHQTSDPTVSPLLVDAAVRLIDALKPFDEGAIHLGHLLVVKSKREGQSSIQLTTLSPVWARRLDEYPELLRDPTAWHTLIMSSDYDVFLCHNADDKPAVKAIAEQLQQRGLRPWLDEWALRPGDDWLLVLEQQIVNIPVAAVFIGPYGEGPWQVHEYRALLQEHVKRKCRVIPVILPSCQESPELPVFLKAFHHVDFRQSCPPPLEALVCGIKAIMPKY